MDLLKTFQNSDLDDAYVEILKDKRIYEGDLQDSVSILVRGCAQAMSTSRASLWLLSEDRQELACLCLYITAEDRFESGASIHADSFPNYFRALMNSRYIAAEDTFTDPRTKGLGPSYLEVLDVRSLLDVTIRNIREGGRIQGVLCTEMVGEHRAYTADEKMFVASIADLLAQCLIASQLAKAEATHQALYEGASEAITVLGATSFLEVNSAAGRLFGCEPDELIGMSPMQVSPEYQPDGQLSKTKAMGYIKAALAGTPQHFDWVHRRLDGTDFDAEVTLNCVLLTGQKTLFGMIRDVTAKKEAERLQIQNHQLELAKRDAEQVALAKMNFLANMSHEIRTPMNGIFGMVSLVLDTKLNAEQQDYVETIQSSTESLLRILNDVLDYSKLTTSEIELETREFNVYNLVADIIRTFNVAASNKGLSLDSSIQGDLPAALLGDDHRIRQILTNLVGNAVKFTERGSVLLSVAPKQEKSEAPGQWIRFSVKDTGIGMDGPTLARLFQPFTQADASITRKYGGTGLGLAICRDLAVAMAGIINVDSEEGNGTTFHFDVCLQMPPEMESPQPAKLLPRSQPTITDLANGQTFPHQPILVVEDNKVNQRVLSAIVKKLGYPVTIANNGREAVELFSKHEYCIILMDLSMPEMDGFEATERIRATEPPGSRATIIAVTGHAFSEHRQQCEAVGIDDFLAKPYNLFTLKEKLDSVTAHVPL